MVQKLLLRTKACSERFYALHFPAGAMHFQSALHLPENLNGTLPFLRLFGWLCFF
jgi:hypothetical protein